VVGQVALLGGHGLLQVPFVDEVVALKDAQRLMLGNGHDADVIDLGASGIGHKRMPQVVRTGMG